MKYLNSLAALTLLVLLNCGNYSIRADVKVSDMPVIVGPVERIGGAKIDETKKIRKFSSIVKHGVETRSCGQNCTEVYTYDDNPESFGVGLMQNLPGTNVKVHLDYILATSRKPCTFIILCGDGLSFIKGKGYSYAK